MFVAVHITPAEDWLLRGNKASDNAKEGTDAVLVDGHADVSGIAQYVFGGAGRGARKGVRT